MSEIWRTKQLEYTWTLTLAGHYADFWTLTERALDYSLARVPSVDKALKPKLLEAYFKLDAFPDARAALHALKAKGHKTGILSNGSPNMLKGAVDAAGIGGELDAVLSVDVLKMFKPRPEVYGWSPTITNASRRRDLRVVQPLGRDGGRFGRLPRALGQPQQNAGRISRLPAGAGAERSQLTADASLGAFGLRAGASRRAAPICAVPILPQSPSMPPIISIANLSKTYASGFRALKDINLDIRRGEIFALLGPNGAGKTTLIGIVCGIVNAIAGHRHRRRPRHRQGLPRRALADRPGAAGTDHRRLRDACGRPSASAAACSASRATRRISRRCCAHLSLWDKKDNRIMTLSGGMKRRVLIAKALAHEPQVLFLDEPTAGVDVELRKDMWQVVRDLRASGVTIILTTHYIEEAEDMADRVGVINKGEIILVEDKAELMRKLGKKQLILHLQKKLDAAAAGAGRARI